MKRILGLIGGVLLSAAGLAVIVTPPSAWAGEKTIRILCSTFPIYQFTRNVTQGRAAAQVAPMLPTELGCPHDYTLTPKDMQLLARADVLVVNGLGLEEFLGAPIERANPALTVIDSSKGIMDLLHYGAKLGPGEVGREEEEHQGVNPHLFVSPRLAARLVLTIAGELSRIDPAGADLYRHNGKVYAAKMTKLGQEVAALGQTLRNKRIITQHGVFDYLARDMRLEVVAVVEAHAGQEPSAAQMLAIIKTAKATQAGAIFAEPQYPAKVVRTLAREAGIKAATLDPMATGPEEAALDYYEEVMIRNMATLKSTLGTL